MTHPQHLDIFDVTKPADILTLPAVELAYQKFKRAHKHNDRGDPETKRLGNEYINLVNRLCQQYGFPPYFSGTSVTGSPQAPE